MKTKREENEGERKTRLQQPGAETKRRNVQTSFKGWVHDSALNTEQQQSNQSSQKKADLIYLQVDVALLTRTSPDEWRSLKDPSNSRLQESERLEMVNSELKAQIEELRLERQQLMVMLNLHRPTCIVRTDSVKTPESEANPLLEQLATETK